MTDPAFSFLTAAEIRFGRGTSGGAAEAAATMGTAVALVHGADPARSDWLARDLGSRGLDVTRISCPREPDVTLIEGAVAKARSSGCDLVVALGGGAVIDTGKAIAALVPATRPLDDHLEVVGKGLPLDHPPLPVIALPTTAGTGAEVTRNAVIGVEAARRKVSLRDPGMLPRLAIVDPALTDASPRAVTLGSGLDAITQVIEPYLSSRANRLTDALCRSAIPEALGALAALMEGEDARARDTLAWTSLCGGLALANSGLGAVHGLAGPVGGMAPAPHGAVCGALLPHVLAMNAGLASGPELARFDEVQGWIAAALGGDPASAPHTLASWSKAQGLPGLGAMGVQQGDLSAIAEAALGSSSMRGNPVSLDQAQLRDILVSAY